MKRSISILSRLTVVGSVSIALIVANGCGKQANDPSVAQEGRERAANRCAEMYIMVSDWHLSCGRVEAAAIPRQWAQDICRYAVDVTESAEECFAVVVNMKCDDDNEPDCLERAAIGYSPH
ncbi:MAG: hypothetical protein FWD57_09570 [Polyangiaceae bacterium]|nr:hypothetical protein [Polyangiaceae bacterium]